MSTIGGPKGPQRSSALQRFLDAERQRRSEKQTTVVGAPSARDAVETGDRFADVPGMSGPNRAMTQGLGAQGLGAQGLGAQGLGAQGLGAQGLGGQASAGQGALSLRLGTMTGADVVENVEKRGLRVAQGPAGKVAEGDLSATKASDLDALKGVVSLRGSFDLSESLLGPTDLLALASLEHIEGSLALEGNAALSSLEALSRLTEVSGNLYLGFNDGLDAVSLPALTRVGGSLIIEGNAALTKLSLPALQEVGGYLHLHEQDSLEDASLSALRQVGGEVSILECPKLSSVDMRKLERSGGKQTVDDGGPDLSDLPSLG